MALATSELDYDLPAQLIATRPAEPRDGARLMVVRRGDDRVEHAFVRDLPGYLAAGDALVFNTTAVAPARFRGARRAGAAGVEGLFVEEPAPGHWLVMLRSGARLRPGDLIDLAARAGGASPQALRLIEPRPPYWLALRDGPGATTQVLDQVGLTPLPPYILRARDGSAVPDDLDRAWYQTVYADASQRESVAAPTAGLHFTPGLLEAVDRAGVRRIDVALHVGPGTFRPVTAATLDAHPMHAERFHVPAAALAGLRSVRASGGRIVAVGTTSVRALESLPDLLPAGPVEGRTTLLIAPPWKFRHVDGLLTNFHLPRSTLLALVGAMVGLARLKSLYAEAARLRYRFYSYGDAMLLL
jgi:S-adenosylmethionine:tRNA ribosyltransferase-isomerase